MSHEKLTLHIAGMHCRSCEILIEQNISKVSGVESVHSNFKHGTAEVYFRGKRPNAVDLETAVRNAGYRLGVGKKASFFSRNFRDYYELMVAAALLAILYFVLSLSGLLSLDFQFGNSPSFFIVLLIGLTAGVSTCMALIGGLVLGISARHAEVHPDATRMQKFRPHLFFNLGRIISYALLGGLIGLLGSAFTLSSLFLGILIFIAGIVMLFLGLKLIEIFPVLDTKTFALPTSISRFLGLSREIKEYSHKGAFITGALTFFLPCGFTQAMQIYAVSTGSFVQGSLIMLLFAIGTMPGLLSLGGLTSTVRGAFASQFFKVVGLAVIVFGVINISNGYNLAGYTLPSVASDVAKEQAPTVPVENGKQIVRMSQLAYEYQPNQFTVKKGVPVKWIITSENQYTCAAYITMPQLGISQALKEGENIIEFTPTRTGKLKFTCSMGMYSGVFTVVN